MSLSGVPTQKWGFRVPTPSASGRKRDLGTLGYWTQIGEYPQMVENGRNSVIKNEILSKNVDEAENVENISSK